MMLGPQHYLALAHRPHASGTLQAAPCLSAPCKRPLECGTLFSCTCAICRRYLANAARASGTLYRVRRCKRPAWNGHPFRAPYLTLPAATAPAAPCRRHPAHATTILAPPLCLRRPAPPSAAPAASSCRGNCICGTLPSAGCICGSLPSAGYICGSLPTAGYICGNLPTAASICGSLPSAASICGCCTCGTLNTWTVRLLHLRRLHPVTEI